ncbi:MAG: Lnb N-terminal periplasmic domain-containing protein [Myxococcaceae bacterium]
MKFRTCQTLLLAFVLSAGALAQNLPPWGTGESQGEDLSVTLVTFGPGPEVISWWGHTALIVEDARLKQRRLYNYGMFSFDEGMLGRFARGRLEFWVGDASVLPTFGMYQRENRDIRLQKLNLSPAKRLQLAKALADNVLPENRTYLYAHYTDNCSTRPRDQIDRAVDGQFHAANGGPGRMTLREHTRRYTAVDPPMSVFLDFMMNNEIDHPLSKWGEAFLPDELEHQLDATRYTNEAGEKVPLVAQRLDFYKSTTRVGPPALPPNYSPGVLLIGTGTGALLLLLGRWAAQGRKAARVTLGLLHAFIAFVMGIPGLALVIMWFFTDHTVTHHNENLFLANPLTLAALPLAIAFAFGESKSPGRLWRLTRLLAALSLLGVVFKVVPVMHQDNWRLFALLLPINLGLAGAYAFRAVDQKAASLAAILFSR